MNKIPGINPEEQRPGGGFNLSSLFLLIALFAIVSAHISPLLNAPVGEDRAHVNPLHLAVLCGVTGAVLGVIVGLQHYRKWRGAGLGTILGLVFGTLSGPVVAASMKYPLQTFMISSGGAVVLLGVAAFFRWMNDVDPVRRRAVDEARLREWLSNE